MYGLFLFYYINLSHIILFYGFFFGCIISSLVNELQTKTYSNKIASFDVHLDSFFSRVQVYISK